jgi:hypothetical protein
MLKEKRVGKKTSKSRMREKNPNLSQEMLKEKRAEKKALRGAESTRSKAIWQMYNALDRLKKEVRTELRDRLVESSERNLILRNLILYLDRFV